MCVRHSGTHTPLPRRHPGAVRFGGDDVPACEWYAARCAAHRAPPAHAAAPLRQLLALQLQAAGAGGDEDEAGRRIRDAIAQAMEGKGRMEGGAGALLRFAEARGPTEEREAGIEYQCAAQRPHGRLSKQTLQVLLHRAKEAEDGWRFDLSTHDLCNYDFSCVDLSHHPVNLQSAQLRGADFSFCQFPPHTDLTSFDLRGCNFAGQDFSKPGSPILDWSRVRGAKFATPFAWDPGRCGSGCDITAPHTVRGSRGVSRTVVARGIGVRAGVARWRVVVDAAGNGASFYAGVCAEGYDVPKGRGTTAGERPSGETWAAVLSDDGRWWDGAAGRHDVLPIRVSKAGEGWELTLDRAAGTLRAAHIPNGKEVVLKLQLPPGGAYHPCVGFFRNDTTLRIEGCAGAQFPPMVDLRHMDLEGCDFSSADFSKGVQLHGCRLQGASFQRTQFPKADVDFRGADLNGCAFKDIDFPSALIIDLAALHKAQFEHVTVRTLSHQADGGGPAPTRLPNGLTIRPTGHNLNYCPTAAPVSPKTNALGSVG